MSVEDLLRRVPLHDVRAEQSVLGAILLDNSVLAAVLDIAEVRDFYEERNQVVLKAMLRLSGDQIPIDATTMSDELQTQGKFEIIGGAAYIAELAYVVPTAAHARHYANIVHNLALVRAAGTEASQIAADSFDRRDAADFLKEAQARLDEVHARLAGPPEPTMAESLAAAIADIRENRRPARLSTGLRALDGMLDQGGMLQRGMLDGGLGRGELVVLAGLTGRGKSALALNIAAHAAMHVGVLYVSLEMPQAQLAERALYAQARVDLTAPLRGLLREELTELQKAQHELAKLSLEIRYRPGLKPAGLRALAQRFQRESRNKFGLLVVDYIGLMNSDTRQERREREIASITTSLKHLAGQLDIAVLALSQFNRAPERRDDRTPRLSDLRDSGAVEQDADIVIFIHEDRADEAPERTVDLIVAKNRRGLSWAKKSVRFIARQVRFEDVPS